MARTTSEGDSFCAKVYNMPTFMAPGVLAVNLGKPSKQEVCEALVTHKLKGTHLLRGGGGWGQEISPNICISAFFYCLLTASTSSVFYTFYFSSGFSYFPYYLLLTLLCHFICFLLCLLGHFQLKYVLLAILVRSFITCMSYLPTESTK